MGQEHRNDAKTKSRRGKQAHLTAYKAIHGCMDCGEHDPIVLELDHRDPVLKDDRLRGGHQNVRRTGLTLMSWEDMLAEIDKCDVVCANCHRRRTALQYGWLDKIHQQLRPRQLRLVEVEKEA